MNPKFTFSTSTTTLVSKKNSTLLQAFLPIQEFLQFCVVSWTLPKGWVLIAWVCVWKSKIGKINKKGKKELPLQSCTWKRTI